MFALDLHTHTDVVIFARESERKRESKAKRRKCFICFVIEKGDDEKKTKRSVYVLTRRY